MSNPTLLPTAETEVVREVYAALNRNDIPAMVKAFAPEVAWAEPDFPQAPTYRGLAAVEAHIAEARATWAEGSCEPARFFVAGDKVVVFVDVRARLKTETEWREGLIADVFTFRDGKVVHVRTFLDRTQALEWAGAET